MKDVMFGTVDWTIKNISKFDTNWVDSDTFSVGGYPWRISIFPRGNNVEYLSIYLVSAYSANFLPINWNRRATFNITVIDQIHKNNSLTQEGEHVFQAKRVHGGFRYFMPLSEFHDPSRGFLVNDTCIISVEVYVLEWHDHQVYQIAPTITLSPTKSGCEDLESVPPIEVSMEMLPTTPSDAGGEDLVDFRGFGKVDKAYIPLLDEVCSQHPSLIKCQQNRSIRFTEWAFTALGRVLYFLKTKKVREMHEEACDELNMIWEELETCNFDLTWLKPHVESALNMEMYLDRAEFVDKFRQEVEALELQMMEFKEILDSAKNYLKTEQDILQDINFDAELGYTMD